jgi:hypothetical protein
MATPEEKVKRGLGAAAAILPLVIKLERDDDGEWKRVSLLGGVLPIWDASWPGVKRRRARREARRRDAR